MQKRIIPAKQLNGEICIPGDKSISHRAIMLGSIASGTTRVTNFLNGADCLSTIACFRQMGVNIIEKGNGEVEVAGKGLWGLSEPQDVLNTGNSGTTTRLMMGILAAQPFYTVLSGDASIRQRPMGRVVKPLMQMGARIWGRNNGDFAPLAISGGALQGINYTLPVASAQLKSALLLAGLYADGRTIVAEPQSSRDHTERMLTSFGVTVLSDKLAVTVVGGQTLTAREIRIPGDISSAAFFMVAAAITPGAELLLKNVGVNPTRTGIIDVLLAMGALIQLINQHEEGGEPVADILVRGSRLKGTVIDGTLIPRLIDEIPVLAVAAVFAEGVTTIRDAAELKVKETNRITAMLDGLGKMGARVVELPDGMIIEGTGHLNGAECESYNDHRIAMALAVAGLRAVGETVINNAECVNISFPDFYHLLDRIAN